MRVFVAHSAASHAEVIATAIAREFRTAGHFARAGCELPQNRWHSFARRSFSDESVRELILSADVLVAVCTSGEPIAMNVGAEIAYFLSRASRERLIIVAEKDAEIPEYLSSGNRIELHAAMSSLKALVGRIEASMKKSSQLIFLSYAREDRPVADEIYTRLTRDGFSIWYDEKALRPGQDWELEISNAIQRSRAFLTCLSTRSVSKRGVFQKELRKSLDVAQEVPEGEIFILPIRLDDCEVPKSLSRYQWCDYREPDDYEKIRESLEALVSA
jgi:hypothetical protein